MTVELPSRREGLTIRTVGDGTVVLDPAGQVHAVSPLAAQVLERSDGATDVAGIRAALSRAGQPVPEGDVDLAIAELGAAGLLAGASRLDRRRLLRHAATAGALGAATVMVSSVAVPSVAAAQSGDGGDGGDGGDDGGGGGPMTQAVDLGGGVLLQGTEAPYHWTFLLTAYGEQVGEGEEAFIPTVANWVAGRPKNPEAFPPAPFDLNELGVLSTPGASPPVTFTNVLFIRTDPGPTSRFTATSVTFSADLTMTIAGISFTSGGFTSLSPTTVALPATAGFGPGFWGVPSAEWLSGTLL